MKFNFGCLILKGPYFNKALQTKFPKLKTFQIVHLKAQVFFPHSPAGRSRRYCSLRTFTGEQKWIFPDTTQIKLRNCYFITVSSPAIEPFVPLQDFLSPDQVQSGWVWQELEVMWILYGFSVGWEYLTLPRTGPRPQMTVAGISVSHQKKTRD